MSLVVTPAGPRHAPYVARGWVINAATTRAFKANTLNELQVVILRPTPDGFICTKGNNQTSRFSWYQHTLQALQSKAPDSLFFLTVSNHLCVLLSDLSPVYTEVEPSRSGSVCFMYVRSQTLEWGWGLGQRATRSESTVCVHGRLTPEKFQKQFWQWL